jgi:hypothetical protein
VLEFVEVCESWLKDIVEEENDVLPKDVLNCFCMKSLAPYVACESVFKRMKTNVLY